MREIRAIATRNALRSAVAAAALASGLAVAQDARRGAELYMQLPGGVSSCVSCHGPEPQRNRNNILRAAGNPSALVRALNTVGPMSYIRASLDEPGLADVAAFLSSVNESASAQARLTVWPQTADFGAMGLGSTSGPQRFVVLNRGSEPAALSSIAVRGSGYALQHDCAAVLPPGGHCTAAVTFSAGAAGPSTGSLQINGPASPASLVTALVATVRTTAATGELVWWPDPGVLDFTGTAVGQATERTLTLVNAGAAPVVLGAPPQVFGSLTLTGDNLLPFSLSGCAAGTSLPASGRCELTVRYTASAVPSLAMLQVRSDGRNPAAVALRAPASSASASDPSPSPEAGTGGGAMGVGGRSLVFLCGLAIAVASLRRARHRSP